MMESGKYPTGSSGIKKGSNRMMLKFKGTDHNAIKDLINIFDVITDERDDRTASESAPEAKP